MTTEHKIKYSFTLLEAGDPGVQPKSLVDELREIEPTIDLLHELCGCGQYAEITRTSDGFFLGRAPNDIGFNAFLGVPSDIALRRTASYLARLSPNNRSIAESILARFDLLTDVMAQDVAKIEHCANCGRLIADDDGINVNIDDDDIYCEQCVADLFGYCDRCCDYIPKDDAISVNSGDLTYCKYCADHYAYQCADCTNYYTNVYNALYAELTAAHLEADNAN